MTQHVPSSAVKRGLRCRCLAWSPGRLEVSLPGPANFGLRNLLWSGMVVG